MERLTVWIMGAPRSGTTLMLNWLGSVADYELDEHPGMEFDIPVSEWRLPKKGSIVHKLCHNFHHAEGILQRFPGAKFIWVERDHVNVINSLANGKPDSWPRRDFWHLGDTPEKRIQMASAWMGYHWQGCWQLNRWMPERVLKVPYETMPDHRDRLIEFTGLPVPELRHFSNRNLDLRLTWDSGGRASIGAP